MAGAPARSLHVLGVEVPPEAHSLAGFRAWVASLPDAGPRLRATFCGGGVYVEDRPQDDDSHAPLVAEVNRVLGNLTVAGELGMYFAPPSSFTHAKAGVSTEPDGMLVRFETFRAGRARVNPDQRTELVGTPDLVLEVVSRSSARKDLVDLVRDYARAGVAEYWIADARAAAAAVDFRVLVLDGRRYEPVAPGRGGWLRSPTFGRRFRLRRLVNAAGLADYRLDSRP